MGDSTEDRICVSIEHFYYYYSSVDNFQLFPTRETLMCILVDDSIDSIQIIDSFSLNFLEKLTRKI